MAATQNICPPLSDELNSRGRFTGKVAIVTGGASGIGKATVERFASDGAAVAIFDINEEAGKDVQGALQSAGHQVKFYSVDVSDRDKCLQAVEQVASEHGGLVHLLVNNAVYFGSKGLNAGDKDWDKTMSVNVQGYSNMVQACHSYMKNAVAGQCAIVNVASVAAYRAQPMRWTYSSSKGAIIALTKYMALDLAKDGIRVNSVSPGTIYTPEVAKAAGGDRKKWEPIWGKYHVLNRFGEPSEIAAAITYLCSRDASFITAADLPVDGGYLALSAEGMGENVKFAGSEY